MATTSKPPTQAVQPVDGVHDSAGAATVAPEAPSSNGQARVVSEPLPLTTAVSIPTAFRFDQVLPSPRTTGTPSPTPTLGPLAAFTGNWAGTGFNTIFRPDSRVTPTPLPVPATNDNVLELNLTTESLSFSPALGSVPNRGMVQADAFLNGVPYLQAINDVTTGQSIGIHLEPGLWMCVPATDDPAEGQTVTRMGSIPHGTTICAQGTSSTFPGAPSIPSVDITPFIAGNPSDKIRFPSQTAATGGTTRIPQDLTSFISHGTITQAMLDDPNSVLRNHISSVEITETTVISIDTSPPAPLFGGGTDNIAFLLGAPAAITNPSDAVQNAQSVEMKATFWIETVKHTILVPVFEPGGRAMTLTPEAKVAGLPEPTFTVRPPIPIPEPRPITVFSTQIQYSQEVFLNFNGLTWPHVSVATLIPAHTLTVPPSAWT